MKYIRTKDTIYEIVEETDLVYRVKAKGNPNNIYSKSKRNTDVIKSADTIEELCDEFVCITNNDELPLLDSFEKIWLYANFYSNEVNKIFGAIWTEKGLIYAAKANKKGELELL